MPSRNSSSKRKAGSEPPIDQRESKRVNTDRDRSTRGKTVGPDDIRVKVEPGVEEESVDDVDDESDEAVMEWVMNGAQEMMTSVVTSPHALPPQPVTDYQKIQRALRHHMVGKTPDNPPETFRVFMFLPPFCRPPPPFHNGIQAQLMVPDPQDGNRLKGVVVVARQKS